MKKAMLETSPDSLTKKLLLMDNYKTNKPQFQFNSSQSRANLLEQSKLSRLPQRKPFRLPGLPINKTAPIAVCVGCGGRLDPDDSIQQSVKACRKCLIQYAVIDAAIEESAKRKIKETLEKFAAEVQR